MSEHIEGLDLMVKEGIVESYTVEENGNVILVPRKHKIVFVTGMIIKYIKPVDLSGYSGE